jgi:hypothetical protein
MGAFYKIVAAENKGEKDNPHGGKLIKWTVALLNSRGDQLTNVYWQRKPDSDVTVGDVIQGKVERGDYGPRFKWEKVPDDAVNPFPPGPQASKPSLSAGVPPPGPTQAAAAPGPLDERSRRIERQHSQSVAVEYARLMLQAGETPPKSPDELRALIDWFAQDVNA